MPMTLMPNEDEKYLILIIAILAWALIKGF
jgi:hypothetical protein